MLVFPANDPSRPSKVWVVEVAQPVFAKGGGVSPVEGVLFYTVDGKRESGKSPVAVIPRVESRSVQFGNLFEAPFQPGDRRADSIGGASIELRVLAKSGSAYDVEVDFTPA
jgi:hypothetical protein